MTGYGRGGRQGSGYGDQDDGQRRDGSVWHGDQGYGQAEYGQRPYDQAGYQGQGHDEPGYQGQGAGYDRQPYGGQPGYGDQQHYADQPGYGDQPGYDDPGYGGDQHGYGDPAYGDPDYGAQGHLPSAPGYPADGGYSPSGGYPAQPGFTPAGYGGYDQEPDDDSFVPGFGARDDGHDGRGGRADAGRYGPGDYDGGYQDQPPRPGFTPSAPSAPSAPGAAGGHGRRGAGGRDPGGLALEERGQAGGGRDDWDDNDGPRQPRRKATRWLPRILILGIVAVLVVGGSIGGLALYHKYQARYHPADFAGPGAGDVTVQVQSGDTAFSLAPELQRLGVIASQRAFTNAVESATNTTGTQGTGLQVGYYVLHEHMSAKLAYAALTNPKNVVRTTVTIPEGKRAVDVIAIVAKRTKIPLKDFQQVLAHPAQLGLPAYADGKAEGYLFPATYAIVPHESALEVLQAMVTRFKQEAEESNLDTEAKTVGLTPTQLIIEASLAQAEGGSVEDYPKIAEVIHNRLGIGMHLQFDSTVLYGLGKYAVSATLKQTKTPGPYNTYLNPGLPAGPISNPGDAAIQGVLHPDDDNYLYFLTKPGGKSEFSHTPLKGQ